MVFQVRKSWSSEEETELIKFFNKNLNISHIAKLLNRSKKSVESKLWALKMGDKL